MSKLLREYVSLQYDKSIIVENIEKKQPIILKSIIQRCDAPNQNNRIYPRNILEREIEKYRKAISENRATGELDHPSESVVSLKNVSHIIREIWWKENEVWGTIEILDTPSGKIAQDLMKSGITLGISSRGVGDVIKNGNGHDVVDESFGLVCFDLVSEPSTERAYLHEAKELSLKEYRKIIPKADRVHRLLDEILRG